MAFRAGLEFLESARQLDFSPIKEHVRNFGNTRNHEHGYDRVQPGQAQRCFEWSLSICQHPLGPEISQTWQHFEMRF